MPERLVQAAGSRGVSRRAPDYLFEDDFDPFADEVEDDDLDDCMLMPDGQCMLAGTEYCDWVCGRLN